MSTKEDFIKHLLHDINLCCSLEFPEEDVIELYMTLKENYPECIEWLRNYSPMTSAFFSEAMFYISPDQYTRVVEE